MIGRIHTTHATHDAVRGGPHAGLRVDCHVCNGDPITELVALYVNDPSDALYRAEAELTHDDFMSFLSTIIPDVGNLPMGARPGQRMTQYAG